MDDLRPELRRIGTEQNPVVIIDGFTGHANDIAGIAERLAPYPPANNYYPGVRRVITREDHDADVYVEETCERAGQFIAGAFDFDSFTLIEASFSIVSRPPFDLSPAQRAPHFDTTDEKHLALLHYLRVPRGSGTAFYRQRSSRIERVTEENINRFIESAKSEAALLPGDSGYISGSDQFFEEIASIEAVPDRLIIYQGSLLHSGIIPADMDFSEDPRRGRLTANLFIRGD